MSSEQRGIMLRTVVTPPWGVRGARMAHSQDRGATCYSWWVVSHGGDDGLGLARLAQLVGANRSHAALRGEVGTHGAQSGQGGNICKLPAMVVMTALAFPRKAQLVGAHSGHAALPVRSQGQGRS